MAGKKPGRGKYRSNDDKENPKVEPGGQRSVFDQRSVDEERQSETQGLRRRGNYTRPLGLTGRTEFDQRRGGGRSGKSYADPHEGPADEYPMDGWRSGKEHDADQGGSQPQQHRLAPPDIVRDI